MKTSEINTIIFDVGKVLVEFDWEGYLDTFDFDAPTYETVANAVYRSPLWDDHDRGLLSDEEYLQLFIENAPDYEAQIRAVFENEGNTVRLYDYTEDWVRSLKEAGFRLYILSNYSRSMYRNTHHKMAFLPYMDGTVFSYEVQQRKPYHCIYKTLLKRYDITPEKAVFIDDRLENIRSAEDLGIHGIVFTGYEDAQAKLQNMIQHASCR